MGSHRVDEPRPFNRKILWGLVIGVSLSATITAIATANHSPVAHETVEVGSSTPLEASMRKDVRLTADEAKARARNEAGLSKTVSSLRRNLGNVYAGAWYDTSKRKLMVGIIDRAYIGEVLRAGAEPRMMKNNLAGLTGQKTRIDRLAATAPPGVVAWYVDPSTNSVVVEADRSSVSNAFIDKVKGGGDLVRVERVDRSPHVLADVVGGRGYTVGESRCSVGFSATGSAGTKHFITAGHCIAAGAAGSVVLANGQELGRVDAGTFDTDGDFGLIDVTNAAAQATPFVDTRDGGPLTLTGTEPAPIGASVCRSGATSGFLCGEITGIDETVNYGDGKIVRGLTRTSVCAEPGDSGGPFVSGTQAQGVTSGGIGDCASNGSTFFQPIVEAATKLDVSVVTG